MVKANIHLSPSTPYSRIQRLQAAASGQYGSYSGGSGSDSCFTIDICPDLLIAGIAAAAAAGFYFLYQQITLKGKRKKREFDFDIVADHPELSVIYDWLTVGNDYTAITLEN